MEAKWKLACGFEKSDCVKTIVICSNHFKVEDYYTRFIGSYDKRKLKPNAVPSVNVPHKEYISPNVEQLSAVEKKNESDEFSEVPSKKLKMDLMTENKSMETIVSSQPKFTELPSTSALESDPLSGEDVNVSTPRKNKRIRRSSPDVATPRRAKRALYQSRYVQGQLRYRIKKLQQDKRRLVKKISTLKELVEKLKSKALISENCGDGKVIMVIVS
ncbi:uncharacterized protein LOC108910889 isoform X2 [Anoplophora glabripennis]|nr:uncharacterized protein LOC108910889 isoform X2 [Anoplophora glabripennis]